MSRHYFDHAATTPIDPRVLDCMEAVHRGAFGNPSSLHAEGRESRRHLEDARESVAADLGAAHASEVVFTGTATEANDLALCGLAARLPTGRTAILASPIEHPSVIETLEELEDQGHPVRWLSVSRTGRIDLSQAPEQLAADVGYSAMMWVNNETGVIQPIEEWAALCRDRGILTHCDAVQAAPRLPIDLSCVPIDTLTISAHKLNGPKGVGALFVRRETPMKPRLLGGGQERGRRAGTENVAGAVGLAKALRLAIEERQQRRAGQAALEQRLIETFASRIPRAELHGAAAPRVPGLMNWRLPGLYGETLLMQLDLAGFAVSLGSACSSGSVQASHVLRAMGLTLEENHSSCRVSFGVGNALNDVDHFVDVVARLVPDSEPG